jgi:hypothetical protein
LGWKHLLRDAGFRLAPQLTTAVISSRARAHSANLIKKWGLSDLNRKLIEEIGHKVLTGPFAGTTLTKQAEEQHIGPYLLGTYEMELHRWVEEVATRRFSQILDVGSSFGYYAVGLARRFPQTLVTAFDTDWWARRAVADMAAANGASNVRIESRCTPAWLAEQLQPGALIVSDCEGYERTLFFERSIPALATATMIVELHDDSPGELAARFRERFSATHAVEEVGGRLETPRVSGIRTLTGQELDRVSHEVRGPQSWAYLRPLTRP